MKRLLLPVLLTAVLGLAALHADEPVAPAATPTPEAALALSRKVQSLHSTMGPLQPGDWLESHEESGQTFAEYQREKPVRPLGKRTVLYVQPLGPFEKTQRRIVDLTAEFLGAYFGVQVEVQRDLALDVIPADARRVHPRWGDRQLLTPYILDRVLRPRLPDDALALIALTASDLYPDPDWNFVFGQASLRHRVGVWSLYRNGDPDEGEAAFRLCLLRTIKIASHETGHMLSIRHCTAYECNMCGCNNRGESDRRPLALCPECLPKVVWGCCLDARKRFETLRAFCAREGLEAEAGYYARCLELTAPKAD